MNPPGTRVLIVDDNDMNVVVARTVLVAGGFVVESASGGAEALAKVAPFGPNYLSGRSER